MIQENGIYQHNALGHTCTVSVSRNGWVEFYHTPDAGLRWLEEPMFKSAYTLVGSSAMSLEGQMNVHALRDQASARGVLIPKEILS